MYNFHISYIKKTYGDCAVFCFTDTESISNEISTNNKYVHMKEDHLHFDFSDYLEFHILRNNLNKKDSLENE